MTNQGAQQNEPHSTNQRASRNDTNRRPREPHDQQSGAKSEKHKYAARHPHGRGAQKRRLRSSRQPSDRHQHPEPERQKEHKPRPRKTHSNEQSGANSDLH
jgi:hypothetical protein